MASNCGQFPLARDAYYYVLPEPEDSFGEQVLPALFEDERTGGTYTTTHAIAPLSLSMSYEQSREFTDTATGTRARVKDRIIAGKNSASYSVETYLDVAAGDTVRGPDVHNLLRCAIGSSDTSDNAAAPHPVRNTKYEPNTTGCLESFNLVRTVPGVFSETLYGCGVDQLSISASGGDPVTLSFSGSAYNHVQTGAFNAAQGVDYSTATTATAIEADPKRDVYQVQPKTQDYAGFTANPQGAASLWSWDESKDAVSGGFLHTEYNKVDAIAEDAGTFTNQYAFNQAGPDDDPHLAGANLLMVPWLPTHFFAPETAADAACARFYTPKPISSIAGTVSITPYDSADGTALVAHAAITNAPITSFEVTVANNLSLISDEFGTISGAAGYIPGMRDVTGSISMRVKKEFQALLLHRRDLFRRCLVAIRLGPAAPVNAVTIDMEYVEFEPSGMEVSGNEELTVTMPFKSMVASSKAADAKKDFVLTWV